MNCRVRVDSFLPPLTAPHTLCDGANIVLDLDRMEPTDCVLSRPGYRCGPPSIWYQYAPGALSASCIRTESFTPEQFPNDHLKDIFGSFRSAGETNASVEEFFFSHSGQQIVDLAPVVLVVTRERTEHANFFHASTDFLNMFITLHVAGVIDGATGERRGLEDVQVLLLDEQRGPFEEAFIRPVFSPNHPVLQVSALRAAGRRRVRLRRALFVPPGYSSIMMALSDRLDELRTLIGDETVTMSHGYCTVRGGSRLFQGYRDFVLGGLGVSPDAEDSERGTGRDGLESGFEGLVRVTFLFRRPYTCDSVNHTQMNRQILNEDELLARLRTFPEVVVTRRDFACWPPREQVAAIAATDVLVAMHGAALTHALYLPDGAAVVEIQPMFGTWRLFEHLARMRGLGYFVHLNEFPPFEDDTGERFSIDPDALAHVFGCATEAVRAVRAGRAAPSCPDYVSNHTDHMPERFFPERPETPSPAEVSAAQTSEFNTTVPSSVTFPQFPVTRSQRPDV